MFHTLYGEIYVGRRKPKRLVRDLETTMKLA